MSLRKPTLPALSTFTTIVALALVAPPAHAADSACAAVRKAAAAGMAQPRIHATVDAPLDAEAIKMGIKPTLMHSVVIDKLQLSNALDPRFGRTPLATAGERELASGLAVFQPETGCRDLGTERINGQPARVTAFSVDLGRGEVKVKFWVDAATGLPLRAVSDEPDFDVDVTLQRAAKGAAAKVNVTERASTKRIVSTHAFLFGDAVKAPVQGKVDAAAATLIQALLKGAP